MTYIQWLITERDDVGKLLLRVSIATFILVYGVEKITNPAMLPYIMGLLKDVGLPSFIAYGVYLGEVLAPILVIVGWHTRLAAALMSFTMVVVILLGHYKELFPLAEFSWWSIELQVLFLLNSLAVLALGAGKFALARERTQD